MRACTLCQCGTLGDGGRCGRCGGTGGVPLSVPHDAQLVDVVDALEQAREHLRDVAHGTVSERGADVLERVEGVLADLQRAWEAEDRAWRPPTRVHGGTAVVTVTGSGMLSDEEARVLRLCRDMDRGERGARWEDLLAASGLGEEPFEECLTTLMDRGLVYEPVLGWLKTTDAA